MTEDEATAYHEAGHAVMGARHDRPPTLVSIVRNGDTAGVNEFIDDMPQEFANHLSTRRKNVNTSKPAFLIALAGMIAHDLRFPERVRDAGDAHDEARARAIIEEYAGWRMIVARAISGSFKRQRAHYSKQSGCGLKPWRTPSSRIEALRARR